MILDEMATFQTKTFFVRYAEERVVLRDVIHFRTEIDVDYGYLDTEFFLRIEIFYAQPPSGNFTAAVSQPDVMQDEAGKPSTVYKLGQTKLF